MEIDHVTDLLIDRILDTSGRTSLESKITDRLLLLSLDRLSSYCLLLHAWRRLSTRRLQRLAGVSPRRATLASVAIPEVKKRRQPTKHYVSLP